ncbi:hypothetical protein F5B22DRAFT_650895 [Xylaria bambusicola]|uniref:uncharacterized protein n=1 Tax=Xylaria bambusicola TaxID=326684 RepID=UPI0020084A54|nr:uncharacterized protein F5B22DRAFT_650895 [Xylaria bambusicola]KAI0506335.1 hypothetical protein F5B22DRAFT_650895 [Xylaria bambusicola]
MYTTKTLGFLVAIGAGTSVAQQFTPAPTCSFLDTHETSTLAPGGILRDPEAYVSELCGLAVDLPQSALSDFSGWGPSLLSFAGERIATYDQVVTECITTGTAASSITSYLHYIVSNPESLCQPTATPTGGNGTASVTITPYPTATPTGNNTNPRTTSIPVAAAARPTEVLVGATAMGGVIAAAILL